MRRGIAAGIALGAVVGACFTKPSKMFGDGGTDGDSQVPDDGKPPGIDAPATCMFHSLDEGVPHCGSWAETLGSAYQQSGQLRLNLAFGQSLADCTTRLPRPFERAILEVVAPIAGSGAGNEQTYFVIENRGERWGVKWIYNGATNTTGIAMACSTTDSTPRAWKPVPEAAVQLRRSGDQLLVELGPSADGPWTPFDMCTVGDEALSDAKVIVGTSHDFGQYAAAVFDSLTLCPP